MTVWPVEASNNYTYMNFLTPATERVVVSVCVVAVFVAMLSVVVVLVVVIIYCIVVPSGSVYVRVSVATSVLTSDLFDYVLLVEDYRLAKKKASIDESSIPTLNFIIALFITVNLLKDIDRYKNSSAFIPPNPAKVELSMATSWPCGFL